MSRRTTTRRPAPHCAVCGTAGGSRRARGARRADSPAPRRTAAKVLGRDGLWLLAAVLLAVYVVVLAVVAAAR